MKYQQTRSQSIIPPISNYSTLMRNDYLSPTPFPTIQPLDYTNTPWLTYQDDVLDLSFRYPANWKITTDSYHGDLGLQAGCKYIAEQGFLRNPATCNDTTIQSLSPGLTLTPPTPVNAPKLYSDQLQFMGPTSGLGGGC